MQLKHVFKGNLVTRKVLGLNTKDGLCNGISADLKNSMFEYYYDKWTWKASIDCQLDATLKSLDMNIKDFLDYID